jgi:hypothetical protein
VPDAAVPREGSRERQGLGVFLGLLGEPALPVLLLALVALIRRGYLLDITLVGGVALLLVLDAPRWAGRTASAEPGFPAPRRPATSAALALLAGVMAVPNPTSRVTDLMFAITGAVLLALVWGSGRSGRSSDSAAPEAPPRWWLWPAIGVAVCLVELSTLLAQPAPRVDSPDHPSMSTLLEPGLVAAPTRWVALWLWLLGCWWLVRRVRAWDS